MQSILDFTRLVAQLSPTGLMAGLAFAAIAVAAFAIYAVHSIAKDRTRK